MDRSHRYHLKGVLLIVLLGTSTASSPSVSVNLDSDRNPELGDSVVLECEADDFKGYDAVFTWIFKDVQIGNMSSGGKYMEDLKSGYSHLTIHDIGHADLGQYECDVRSSAYGKLSGNYNLDFDFSPALYMSERQVKIGDAVTMLCRHNPNQGDWKFEDRRENVLSSAEYIQRFVNHVTSLGAPEYMKNITLHNVTLEQSGNYICFNKNGQPKEDKTSLDVLGMTIICHSQNNQDMILTEGVDDTVVCTVQANPAIERDADVGLWWSPTVGSVKFEKIPNDVCSVGMEPGPPLTSWTLTIDINGKYVYRLINKRIKIQIKDQYVYINMQIQQRCQPPCGLNMKCDMKGQCSCTPGFRPNPVGIGTGCVLEGNESTTPGDEWGMSGGQGGDKDKDKDDDAVVVRHTSVATIVGSTFGALAMVLLVLLLYICYRRWKKKADTQKINGGTYTDPSALYQYEYHSEANLMKDNPAFTNPAYGQMPKQVARKENTYVSLRKDELEFPRENLQLGVDLGQGRFGKVIQARALNISGNGKWTQVAVKTCRGTATDSEKQDLFLELEIMRKIPLHPNVVTLYGCCSKLDPLYIILEYVQRGSLMNYLRQCRPSSRMSRGSTMTSVTTSSSFMEPRAKDLTIFALQISRGMSHIANLGIIHRDLAARNILLATDFTCKICDFGLARDVEGIDVYERTSKGPLPIRWMAPEALADNMFTRKSDVWSYGVLLWEIVTLGATPYAGVAAMEVMRKVMQGQYLQRPLHCREEMYMLMEKCWQKPEDRPSFADIVAHHEALMDDDYILLSDYEESDYGWLDSYTMDERV
ncbi:proto-oncogene tyrosine-protein kinase receptor Ret-like isoform X2 [Mya arenaria]|uniref:proto-oncogene tyrosine-protein kinase receptor Ret-like isoform X2 n=1 Tax=Mya arenaria TaxID=6604 RepID=UPI0022E83941|nr:proto-oncogene tyrosine-protein kinase receptor Ret-like isoform X2 [Mya arenaria]